MSDRLHAFLYGVTDKEAGPFTIGGSAPPEPSDKQKKAGNYKKDIVKWNGLTIAIENRAGTTRSGKGKRGGTWSIKMPWHYGYFKRTPGNDLDGLDCFLKPDSKSPFMVYIIKQVDPYTKRFDEYKCMLGWRTRQEAVEAYKQAYEKGWNGYGGCMSMSIVRFKKWLKDKGQLAPVSDQRII